MRLTACIAHRDDEVVWSAGAVASLVGQRPMFQGQPAEVIRAWLDGDRVMAELEVTQ